MAFIGTKLADKNGLCDCLCACTCTTDTDSTADMSFCVLMFETTMEWCWHMAAQNILRGVKFSIMDEYGISFV